MCLLKDQRHDANLWEPLRRGQTPARLPVQVHSQVDKDGGKTIRFVFEKLHIETPRGFSHV